MPNVFEPSWDIEREDGWRRAYLGRQARGRRLGASLYELPPGGVASPMHAHHANEELAVVLSGTATLRTPDGEELLRAGDVRAFPAGRDGAHQLRNESGAPARVLIVSTMLAPEINEMLDSGEIWVRDYVPGTEPPPGALDVRLPRPDSP